MTTVSAPFYQFEVEGEGGDLVEVLVSADDIREAGWIRESDASSYCEGCCQAEHCGSVECECELAGPVLEALADWHNDNHAGVFRFCDEQPCKAARRAAE